MSTLFDQCDQLEALAGAEYPVWRDTQKREAEHSRVLELVRAVEREYPDALPQFRSKAMGLDLGLEEQHWSLRMDTCREAYRSASRVGDVLRSCDLPGRLCPSCGPWRFVADHQDDIRTDEEVRHFVFQARRPAQALRDAGYLGRVRERLKGYLRTGRGESPVSGAQATYFAPVNKVRAVVVANAIVTVPATEASKLTDSRGWEVAALENTEPSALERYWHAGFEIERETLQGAEAFASAVNVLVKAKRLSNLRAWYARERA